MTNAFREDEEKQLSDRDSALANAPDKADGNFIVPKVVGWTILDLGMRILDLKNIAASGIIKWGVGEFSKLSLHG